MKLHRLEVRAFGPFAEVERVDFDALGQSGIHLIHGATGAGKTSILDAVCYALYGGVPGSRQGHREGVRSDHAEPDVQPYSLLEFTAAGIRRRIRRSPEYQAPKKRGTGTTRRQATVQLDCWRGGRWVAESSRMDEAGDIVTQHVGMGLAQFAQVVLLPQGQFATFLQARAEDRAALLRTLFDVDRFDRAQDWLTDRRRELATIVREADLTLGTHRQRLIQVLSTVEAPPEDADEVAVEPDSPLPLGPLLHQAHEVVAERTTQAMVESDLAARERDRARDLWQSALRTIALQREARLARAVCAAYDERAPEREATREAVDAAHRAATVHPLVTVRTAAATELQAAHQRVADATPRLVGLLAASHRPGQHRSVDGPVVESALRSGSEVVAELPSTAARREQLEVRLQQLHTERAESVEAASASDDAVGRADDVVGALRGELDAGSDTSDAVDPQALVRAWEHVRRLLSLWESSARAARTAADRSDTATRAWTTSETEVLDLRRRRLAGVVGAIAADLSDDTPCPVCGSREHPDPAEHADSIDEDAVSAAEHRAEAARERQSVAQAELAAARARCAERATACWDAFDVTGVESACDTQQSVRRSGDDGTDERALTALGRAVDTGLVDARAALLAAQDATRERARVSQALATAEQVQRRSAEASDEARQRVRRALDRCADVEQERGELHERIEHLRAEHDRRCCCRATGGEVRDLLDTHHAAVLASDDLRSAERDLAGAQSRAKGAERDLTAAMSAHGFGAADEVRDALLDPDAIRMLQAQVDTADAEQARALGVLGQDHVVAAEQAEPPDPTALEQAARSGELHRAAATRAASDAERALREIETLTRAVGAIDDATAAARAELDVVGPLADTAAGQGDNTLRMRLTSYVLAARLEVVTTLANERLQVMSGGRYGLEHSDDLARGGARSGLGLRVVDAWTGSTRDTATLSGGEAFVASLALALGLGDAVLQDSGGRPLESLFVDEGFGSLDEETLDQVMEVLDGLRAGGRSVGIVSHVAELRHRVQAQVEVHKTERGSHIVVHDAPSEVVA